MNTRKQLSLLLVFLVIYAFLAFATYMWVPLDQIGMSEGMPASLSGLTRWQLALANAGFVFLLYGLIGLAGIWFARQLQLPGVFREGAGWRSWLVIPLVFGLVVGVVLVAADRVFASFGSWGGFEHPQFPLSLIASASAGIGEEILFRMFVMGLWAFLLNLLLRRWHATNAALWIANLIAALAFAAGHLPSAMALLEVTTPAQIPSLVLVELFLLNGVVGLVAGERYMRDGLVAAAGVHFWADIVWHVIWPLLAI